VKSAKSVKPKKLPNARGEGRPRAAALGNMQRRRLPLAWQPSPRGCTDSGRA
jgi:hypothetical protein